MIVVRLHNLCADRFVGNRCCFRCDGVPLAPALFSTLLQLMDVDRLPYFKMKKSLFLSCDYMLAC